MMDETKFAGYKDTLVHAAKQMAEEYSDAMNYAGMAMDYKTVCPYASSEWYKLSGEEMEHADANRRAADNQQRPQSNLKAVQAHCCAELLRFSTLLLFRSI